MISVARRLPWIAGLALAGVAPAHGQIDQFDVPGAIANQQLGTRIAGLGDVDGDGRGDLLLTSYGLDVSPPVFAPPLAVSGAGGALLYALPAGGPAACAGLGDVDGNGRGDFAMQEGIDVAVRDGAAGALLWSGQGPFLFASYGADIARVADVTGDGVDEVLIGAPGGLIPMSPATVDLRSGANGALLLRLSPPGGFSTANVVAGAGDFDGDGAEDLAFVVNGDDVRVASGATGATLRDFVGAAGEGFGAALAPAGDVDGDGRGDLAVGAPTADPGGLTDAGQVRIYSGATGALLLALNGTAAGDRLGAALAAGPHAGSAGEVVLLAGAPGAGGGAGAVRGFAADGGALLFQRAGTDPGGSFGAEVANAGDLDGDGFPDWAAAAPLADPAGTINGGRAVAFSAYGIPPGSALFGSGCPGATTGAVPVVTTTGGPPSVAAGNPGFAIALGSARPGAPVIFIAGLSNTTLNGVIPLPVNLGPLGAPGCTLDVSLQILAGTVADAAGRSTAPFPIGANPAQVGVHVYFQWYVVDPGPAALPGATSRGLDVALQ